MKIQYGNLSWSPNPYFLVLIMVLFTERLFLDFFIEPEESSAGTRDIVTALALVTSVLIFPRLDRFLKIWLVCCFLFLGFLFLESYYHYRTFFVYPHVFSKLTAVFMVPFAYTFFRDAKKKYIRNYVYFVIFIFVLHIVIIKPHVLSFESFIDTERGVTAGSLFLMVLPALFLFNRYMERSSMGTLFLLLIVLGFIIFLQHRSVWMATLAAFVVNTILIKKKASFNINFASVGMIFLVPIIIGAIFSSLVLSKNPEVVEKFKQRVEDIQKVDEQGTGNWRLQQAVSYWPFIQEHMVFGMRFAGFELPIQFYQESTGKIYFEDNTGHHFHSLYVDALFYLGLVGLLLKLAPIFYAIKKAFSMTQLSNPQISLVSYLAGSIIYGIAYNFPLYLYAFMGIAIAYFNQFNQEDQAPEKKEEIQERELVST
jgi:hypothetical protein